MSGRYGNGRRTRSSAATVRLIESAVPLRISNLRPIIRTNPCGSDSSSRREEHTIRAIPNRYEPGADRFRIVIASGIHESGWPAANNDKEGQCPSRNDLYRRTVSTRPAGRSAYAIEDEGW